jgi:hypothetical protein
MVGNCQSHQRDYLNCTVCSYANRAAFVINLAYGMRVRDLNHACKQNQRNTDDPEPTRPGLLKTLFCI